MGLGSSEPQRRVYYLSPRATDKDKKICPHFKITVKEGGGYRDMPDETSVSGYLVAIGHGGYEHPKGSGDFNETIKIYLVDGEDMFKIEGNVQSNMMRSLMNTVIGTRDFDLMKISLYAKDGFPNIFITNNDEKTEWKFDYKNDIEPLIQVVPDPKKPGKTVKVYHEVDKKLMHEWQSLEPYVAKRAKEKGYSTAPAAETTAKPIEQGNDAPPSTMDLGPDPNLMPIEDEAPF